MGQQTRRDSAKSRRICKSVVEKSITKRLNPNTIFPELLDGGWIKSQDLRHAYSGSHATHEVREKSYVPDSGR